MSPGRSARIGEPTLPGVLAVVAHELANPFCDAEAVDVRSLLVIAENQVIERKGASTGREIFFCQQLPKKGASKGVSSRWPKRLFSVF